MDLSFRLTKSKEFIFDYLTDMRKFQSVHPVITKIYRTSENNYIVHETLKFGILPFSFTYPATIEQNRQANEVTIRATVFRLTKIEMKFNLSTDSNSTIINEKIKFSSPLPIKRILKKTFQKQHDQLFKNIDALQP